ncbi:MAG TPA: KEOPS complex subunit Pcc1 [Nitrososphaera sp.]|nr:KEOPS complex subunit Pcc1 [Nitrososphaera sp.]
MDAQVSIPFPTSAHARAAVKALIPDNVNMPAGLTIDIFSRGTTVWVRVGATGSGISIATVASTLDEILEHISVARKVVDLAGMARRDA